MSWWRRGVIYEIYPRSFQDSDGDGIGDLRGIARRLPYLRALGVDAIWLTPIYPSPQRDFGYDITDHEAIDRPWLPLGDLAVNVADQLDDPRSMLALHGRLLALRRAGDDLAEGNYRTLHAGDGVLAYRRGRRTAVALNLTGEPRPLPVRGSLVLSTHVDGGASHLRAHEGVLLNCDGC